MIDCSFVVVCPWIVIEIYLRHSAVRNCKRYVPYAFSILELVLYCLHYTFIGQAYSCPGTLVYELP